MKKISAVLLVLVLVGSVAFAGFTGNAEANFGMDLDTQQYGFENDVNLTSDIVFFETLVDNAGDGDIYAEIKATLTLAFDFEDQGNEYDAHTGVAGNAEITSAKIGGDNWYVSILGAMAAPNFASSVIDVFKDVTEDEDVAVDLDPSVFVTEGAGVEVMYADYKFGIAATRDATNDLDAKTYDIFGSVITPDFALADGLTLAFGAAGRLSDVNNAASGSVKGTYTMDDITASVAADVVYDTDLMAEVAVNAVVDIVTLDVYFATHDKSEYENVAGTAMIPTLAYNDATNILSAKAAFAIDEFTITVTGKDLIHSQAFSGSVKYQATEELAVTGRGGYTLNGGAWEAGADLEYAVEDYTAALSGTFKSGEILEMAASIESTTIVPGATLKLAWVDADDVLSKNATAGDGDLGKVIASANIAF
jgi:hypothetical protein